MIRLGRMESPPPQPAFDPGGQLCPRFQRATELVGKRWTGAIVRVLMPGPLRFNELLARVTGISDRLLSERLRELESVGIVKREVSPGPPVRVAYELTCSGHELEPVVGALEAWAQKWIAPESLEHVSDGAWSPNARS
jgi:DNA-binding HxlR family transcriptional regulator